MNKIKMYFIEKKKKLFFRKMLSLFFCFFLIFRENSCEATSGEAVSAELSIMRGEADDADSIKKHIGQSYAFWEEKDRKSEKKFLESNHEMLLPIAVAKACEKNYEAAQSIKSLQESFPIVQQSIASFFNSTTKHLAAKAPCTATVLEKLGGIAHNFSIDEREKSLVVMKSVMELKEFMTENQNTIEKEVKGMFAGIVKEINESAALNKKQKEEVVASFNQQNTFFLTKVLWKGLCNYNCGERLSQLLSDDLSFKISHKSKGDLYGNHHLRFFSSLPSSYRDGSWQRHWGGVEQRVKELSDLAASFVAHLEKANGIWYLEKNAVQKIIKTFQTSPEGASSGGTSSLESSPRLASQRLFLWHLGKSHREMNAMSTIIKYGIFPTKACLNSALLNAYLQMVSKEFQKNALCTQLPSWKLLEQGVMQALSLGDKQVPLIDLCARYGFTTESFVDEAGGHKLPESFQSSLTMIPFLFNNTIGQITGISDVSPQGMGQLYQMMKAIEFIKKTYFEPKSSFEFFNHLRAFLFNSMKKSQQKFTVNEKGNSLASTVFTAEEIAQNSEEYYRKRIATLYGNASESNSSMTGGGMQGQGNSVSLSLPRILSALSNETPVALLNDFLFIGNMISTDKNLSFNNKAHLLQVMKFIGLAWKLVTNNAGELEYTPASTGRGAITLTTYTPNTILKLLSKHDDSLEAPCICAHANYSMMQQQNIPTVIKITEKNAAEIVEKIACINAIGIFEKIYVEAVKKFENEMGGYEGYMTWKQSESAGGGIIGRYLPMLLQLLSPAIPNVMSKLPGIGNLFGQNNKAFPQNMNMNNMGGGANPAQLQQLLNQNN